MLSKLIDQTTVDRLSSWISYAERIVVVSHVSPDGDAVGSALAWGHFLREKGKKVSIIVPNAFPEFLAWLPGASGIIRYDRHTAQGSALIAEADVIFCLDFNELSRIDAMASAVGERKAHKVLIDHHLHPADFCGITISHPELCATSELIFRLICALGCRNDIHRSIAECIYTGMMTDTGGFTYNSNNRETYFIISELLTTGIDKDEIYRRVYNTYSESRLRMMGYVLSEKMVVLHEYHTAFISLTQEEQDRYHLVKGDTEGFVNIPLSIKGVIFTIFLREDREKKMIKVSLRSVGEFPCNRVAADFFHGGGHRNASGGEHFGTIEEAIALVKQAIVKYEKELKRR